MSIKQSIFRYIAARMPQRQVAYLDFHRANSILLLYESEWQERNADIRAIATQLRDQGKQVVCWGYVKKDKPLSPNLPDSRMLGTKDFSILGKPKAEILQYLEHHPFDVLLDLTTSPVLSLQYVALYAKAQCKIGSQNTGLYNLVVQTPADATADYLFQQMLHYIQLIKSAD